MARAGDRGVIELSWAQLALAALIMAFGAVMQVAIGLGFALAAIPLLALIDLRLVPGPVLIAGAFLAGYLALKNRSHVDRGEYGVALIGLAFGSALGTLGLYLLARQYLGLVFGGLILLAVALSIASPPFRLTTARLLAGSTVSGVMGMGVGMHGPPLALVFQNEAPEKFRAMLNAFFAPAVVITLAGLAIVGRFDWGDFLTGLILLPGVVLGYFAAPLVARFLDRTRMRWAVLAIATASAVALILR